MRFIDTHTHLYDEAFDNDVEEVLGRMEKAGVQKCILPAIERATYARQSAFAGNHKGMAFEAIGLHPTSVKGDWREEMAFVEERLACRNGTGVESCEGEPFVAIGEIGLDCYWSKEYLEEQKEVFFRQLLIAIERELPVIVHTREATEELFDVLERVRAELSAPYGGVPLRGVFHAWSGSPETYARLCRYSDFYVGIGGVVTYKNSGVGKRIEEIAPERILLETDSPWLTPVPMRGKRNESAYITFVAQKVAEVKGMELERIAEITSRNAELLFRI